MCKSIRTFVLAFLILGIVSCDEPDTEKKLSTDLINNPVSADGSGQKEELPKFKFVKLEHDFGKIIDGVKVAYKYKFTNVGGSDLIIDQVKTTCGCTISKYPTEPVKPGETKFIELTFDSSRRKGFNQKSATVVANTQPNVVKLILKATVVSADEL